MKKIKITKCKSPSFWYKHLIGKEIDVTKFDIINGDAIITGKELKKIEPENAETSKAFVCREDFDIMPDVIGHILGTDIRMIKEKGVPVPHPDDSEKFKSYMNSLAKKEFESAFKVSSGSMRNLAIEEIERQRLYDLIWGDVIKNAEAISSRHEEMERQFLNDISSFSKSTPFEGLDIKNWFNSESFGKCGERKPLSWADSELEKMAAWKEAVKSKESIGFGIPVFNQRVPSFVGMDFGQDKGESIISVTKIDLEAETAAKLNPLDVAAEMAKWIKEKNIKIRRFIINEAFVTFDQISELIAVFQSEDNPLESNSDAYAKILENMGDQLSIAMDDALNNIADFKARLNAK